MNNNKLFIDLDKFLTEKKLPHMAIADTYSYHNDIYYGWVFCQGWRVNCYTDRYQIRAIKNNELVEIKEPIITPEDVYHWLTKGIYRDTPIKLMTKYLIEGDPIYMTVLPKQLKLRMRNRRKTLEPIIKLYHDKKATLEDTVILVEKELMREAKITGNGRIKQKDCAENLRQAIVPKIKSEIVIDFPIQRNLMLDGTITLENLIIFDILHSFPYLIKECMKWNKEGTCLINIQNSLDRRYKTAEKRTLKQLSIGWVYTIKTSAVKEMILRNLIDYLGREERWKLLKTNNLAIWNQLLIAYRVIKVEDNMDKVPKQFLQNLSKINLFV